jgi:hypothetical protein
MYGSVSAARPEPRRERPRRIETSLGRSAGALFRVNYADDLANRLTGVSDNDHGPPAPAIDPSLAPSPAASSRRAWAFA